MAARFQAWRDGRKADLVRWWRDARSYAWADADKDKTQMGEEQSEETRRKDGIDRAMDLIGEGEISRAVAIATSEGAAAVTPYVKEQLRTKFPRRTKAVNSSIEGVATSCIAVHLMGELQQLPKGAAAGPNGMRNEFLRVLAQKFGGESAKEIGRRLKCVAEMIARRELPQWYYLLMSTTKLVPLIKSRNPWGPGPDVRPVQVGDPLITTIWKALLRDMQEKLAAIFRPEQVAVGVKGGLSIMIHGMRALLQQSPEMVCVKMDLKNAFNEVERASLVEAVREQPQLHSLLPLMTATYTHETWAMLGRTAESLFGEEERGDASQGGPQGNPLMGAAFCLAIHPYVKRLHARLAEAGGEAKADMDDCYATGPASVVFEAIEECLLGLSEIGLVARVEKFEVYSPLTDVTDNPIRKRLGIPLRNPSLPQGLPCGGVPLGSAAYEAAEAGKIATEVVREIDRVTSAFKGSPHHLWKATTLSSLSRFDYWLQHLAPEHTSEAAKLVDAAIDRAVLACLQGTRVAEDMLIKKRLALPTRMGGGDYEAGKVCAMPHTPAH